jgi:hypothetical protein
MDEDHNKVRKHFLGILKQRTLELLTSGALPAKMAAFAFAVTHAFVSFATNASDSQTILQILHDPTAIYVLI